MPKSRNRLPLSKSKPSKLRRKQYRIAVRAEKRLQQMLALLPPGRGNRRNEFSSSSENWEAAK